MIEVTDSEDDLFTEPADEEKLVTDTQNESDFDTLATGIAEFYWGLRKRKVPRKEACELTDIFLSYMLTLGGRI